jgi:hypothetical protein
MWNDALVVGEYGRLRIWIECLKANFEPEFPQKLAMAGFGGEKNSPELRKKIDQFLELPENSSRAHNSESNDEISPPLIEVNWE